MVGRKLTEFYPEKIISQGDVILSVKGASRQGEFEDIDFELHQGEILGIAGLTGAGRTELVSALFGASPLDAGDIRIHNCSVKINSTEKAVSYKLALITEDRKLTGFEL